MTRLLKLKKSQKGQAVLVILLVMSVMLTLGLSVVSRSITDVKISQQSQESARAFWTAQSGLENALLNQSEVDPTIIDGVTYTVLKSPLGDVGSSNFVFSEGISPGESFTYWLVDHETDGNIGTNFYGEDSVTVYWGEQGGEQPALEATLLYRSGADYFTKKYAFDPLEATRETGFDEVTSGNELEGVSFTYKAVLDSIPSDPYYINFKMLYSDTPQKIGIQTNGNGYVQGSCYESKAVVDASGITRALRECRTWPKTPEIFNFLLFSKTDLVK